MTFDLDAYLDRIGLDTPPGADLDGLRAVQWAQLSSVPFENLDIPMGRGIDVTPAAVFDKIVTHRRGGYCFENNLLLNEGLAALGFETRPLLGRVMLDNPAVLGRTHMLVRAQVGGEAYMVDCGFGAGTPRGPIPLVDGGAASHDGVTWTVSPDDEFGWRMTTSYESSGESVVSYVFDESTVYPADIELGNHYTSTCPTSKFVRNVFAVRRRENGTVVVNNRTVAERVGPDATPREIADRSAFESAIRDEVGLDVQASEAEWDRLWATAGAAAATV